MTPGEAGQAQKVSPHIVLFFKSRFHYLLCCHPKGWVGRESTFAHQVSTAEDNGILLYNGDNDHIAVELYQGHVRVSYDPGSYPSSAIYRYSIFRPPATLGVGYARMGLLG